MHVLNCVLNDGSIVETTVGRVLLYEAFLKDLILIGLIKLSEKVRFSKAC